MIKLHIVRANTDINIGKHSFTKHQEYFARQSRDGNQILVQVEQGIWCSMVNITYAKGRVMLKKYKENFTVVETLFAENWAEVKKITGG